MANATLLSELDSVSSAIADQLSYLPSTGPSSHLLHPLGPIPPPFLAPSLSASLHSIHSSALRLPPTVASAQPPTGNVKPLSAQADPGRHYLALLSESATSRALLQTSQGAISHAQQLYQRSIAHLPPQLPTLSAAAEHPSTAARLIADLEAIGTAVGLAGFKDESSASTQLSLGGKCVVVDVSVENEGGKVQSVKVAYALPAPVGQREDERIARDLLQALKAIESSQGEEERSEVLRKWMALLAEVNRLDVMAEASGRDAFRQASAMGARLGEAVSASAAKEETVLLANSSSLRQELLWHASPLARASEEWDAALASAWTDSGAIERLLAAGGAHALKVTLEEPAPEPGAEGDSVPTQARFLAHFIPAVPMTKPTGRRIRQLLSGATPNGAASAPSSNVDGASSVNTGDTTWFEDLIISAPTSKASDPIARFDSSRLFDTPFADLPFTPSFRLAEPGTVQGYLCTDVRVSSAEQLSAVIEVLKEHLAVDDLLESVLAREFEVQRSSADRTHIKRTSAGQVTLDDLFGAPPTNALLPIDLHISAIGPGAPLIALGFPSPHTPPHEAFPITLTLSPQEGTDAVKVGVNVPDTEQGQEARSKLVVAELEGVVTRSRDLGLLVRAVAKRLLA